MTSIHEMTRRALLTSAVAASGGMLLAAANAAAETQTEGNAMGKGRLKQSVSRWCFGKFSLEDLAREAGAIGIEALDLLDIDEVAAVQAQGLTCGMVNGPGNISDGWNNPDNHDRLVKKSEELIPRIAEAGLTNMIVMSGNRRGISDEEGMTNCARGLERILPLAESRGIILHMELLNSKRDHKDYQCDHTAWGAALAKSLGSTHFKLLYDIYHMQIMEGDIIDTIQRNIEHIGHFHTGGCPGRNEIDETQELNYRRICEAIADTGFTGFLAHEFVPRQDPLASLRRAFEICSV